MLNIKHTTMKTQELNNQNQAIIIINKHHNFTPQIFPILKIHKALYKNKIDKYKLYMQLIKAMNKN